VLKGDKIGIVGPNGTGKTTLLRMLTREVAPSEGVIRWGHNVDVGYYDQSLQLVDDTNTVLGELRSLDGQSSDGALRGLLAAFGFTDDMIEQPVRSLSGGERARLSLLHLIFERHNTVLLDEPTNHLDTDAREAIEASLIDYAGTLICVSHDRYFLNRICDRIFAFEKGDGDHDVRQVLGNYDDYRRDRQQRRQSASAAPTPTRPAAPMPPRAKSTSATQPEVAPSPRQKIAPATRKKVTPAPGQKVQRDVVPVDDAQDKRQLSKNQLSKIRREIADLEEEIALLEEDLERIGQQMSSGEHAGDSMAQQAQNAAALQETLRGKLGRWERLNALMER